MAKQTTTTITDDLDGTKDATEVAFTYNGVDYTIDLGKKNAAAFEKALKPYIEAGTKVNRRSSSPRRTRSASSSTASRTDLAQVREWAKSQGIEVSERGRVSASVLEQYDAAN
jgi:hypothetical protein